VEAFLTKEHDVARAKSTVSKAPANSQPTAQAQVSAQASASESVSASVTVAGAETAATVNAADNKSPENMDVPVLVIRTKRGITSFRRAGHHFTREAKTIAADELSADQLDALRNEPRLEIEQGSAESAQ
jgi:hypothetical protein